jgi:hypothetical protein
MTGDRPVEGGGGDRDHLDLVHGGHVHGLNVILEPLHLLAQLFNGDLKKEQLNVVTQCCGTVTIFTVPVPAPYLDQKSELKKILPFYIASFFTRKIL